MASPSLTSIIAVAPAGRQRAALGEPGLEAAVGAPPAAVGRRAERAGHADQVAGARAVAAHQLGLGLRPARHGHGHHQRAARTTSPPAIVTPQRSASAAIPPTSSSASDSPKSAGQGERHVRLAGVRPHRREVGERGRQRLVADVAGVCGGALEVHALGDRVDRRDRHRPGAHHRGVVARPAHHPRPRRARGRRGSPGSDRARPRYTVCTRDASHAARAGGRGRLGRVLARLRQPSPQGPAPVRRRRADLRLPDRLRRAAVEPAARLRLALRARLAGARRGLRGRLLRDPGRAVALDRRVPGRAHRPDGRRGRCGASRCSRATCPPTS